MSVELRIYLGDGRGMDSLRAWLDDVQGVSTEPVPAPSGPGEQGDVWAFLSVVCGAGGAITVALNALSTWVESRVTQVRVRVGETEVELRGPDPDALARLLNAAGEEFRELS
ncbi:hypothetical protein ACFQ6N_30010 [Kitasatospora sp. NPDC056446]|uniref:effector-associated constant component EACC1 n=1 Tax=Kitasatospora sp. NPDC056446 TaxID=3345819 RepID=UPI0036BEFCE6